MIERLGSRKAGSMRTLGWCQRKGAAHFCAAVWQGVGKIEVILFSVESVKELRDILDSEKPLSSFPLLRIKQPVFLYAPSRLPLFPGLLVEPVSLVCSQDVLMPRQHDRV